MKKLLRVLSIIIALLSLNVYAEENNSLNENIVDDNTIVESSKDSEKDENTITGWQEIDGYKYYYDKDGNRVTGFQIINEKLYFFSKITGQLKYGWQGLDGNKWYQDETGEVLKGLQELEGNKYYFNEEGFLQTGFQIINEKRYFFSKITGQLKYGWQGLDGNKWYQDETGEVLKGLQELEGNKYYFNEEGFLQTGFQIINEKRFFFSKITGQLKYGWQGLDGNKWYQDKTGEVLKGLQELEGNKYYFNEEGFLQTGFQDINGKRYFFSKMTGQLKYGWQGSENNYWYQDDTGALITGSQNINGRDYNFDIESGLLKGFTNKDGKLYYYNPDGSQAKGIQYMIDQFWKFNEKTGEFEKFVREVRTIDVSAHQGNVDWDAVKRSGKVDAVILRLGFGVGYIDTQFIRNKNELERLGIPYSVYLFSYAENKNEALMESNFFVKTIQDNNANIASNIFSLFYDLEDWEIKSTGENSYGISKETYGDMITTFIDNTEKKTCIKTRVYASKNYIEERFPQDKQYLATWVAQWSDTLTYKGPYEGWQYTDCEYVPGINGCVDMSKFYY